MAGDSSKDYGSRSTYGGGGCDGEGKWWAGADGGKSGWGEREDCAGRGTFNSCCGGCGMFVGHEGEKIGV